MTEMRTLDDFDEALKNHHHIMITDTANGETLHKLPCSRVKREHFEVKVIKNNRKNGRYYLVANLGDATTAKRCSHC